ncbi:MAG: PorT family protein [Flavobacteriales bacterium]|nr:PorT family protein [Flavobacteriales bacterium]MCW8913344.1 PorT family protein [Flavobacteriales bacterium]MCW8936922.1 PorT family protein [Flavobacteriales bacterium]MCW8939335.1 PorT family protein [Flavobacteriales bacterium]MCW8968617.1 PorT family protein [Flavobacteriales bacterium]
MKKSVIIKPLFLVAMLLTFHTSYGQEQDSIPTKKSKFSIGIAVSPEMGYRSFSPTSKGEKNDFLMNVSKPMLDSLESPKFCYSFGIYSTYQLSKRFSLELGIYYANKGYKADDIIFTTVFYPEETEKGSIFYNYRYIDVPLNVNFYIINRKVKLFLSAGLTANILINQKNIVKIDNFDTSFYNDRKPTRNDIAPFNMAFNGSLGLEYELSQHFNLRLQPHYQQFLTAIQESEFATLKLYNYGIRLGTSYHF